MWSSSCLHLQTHSSLSSRLQPWLSAWKVPAFPWDLPNSCLSQNILHPLPAPILNQLASNHPTGLTLDATSLRKSAFLDFTTYVVTVYATFQNSCKNACQDCCRTGHLAWTKQTELPALSETSFLGECSIVSQNSYTVVMNYLNDN